MQTATAPEAEHTPWLSPTRDASILHYGEPACLCLTGEAQELKLTFRRNRVAPLQVVQFAREEEKDAVWQVRATNCEFVDDDDGNTRANLSTLTASSDSW